MLDRIQAWDDAIGDAPWAKAIPPAPGHLRFVQAFVNTADLGSAPDELGSPSGLASYLARWKLLQATRTWEIAGRSRGHSPDNGKSSHTGDNHDRTVKPKGRDEVGDHHDHQRC